MTIALTSSSVLSLSCVSSSAGSRHSAVSRSCSVVDVELPSSYLQALPLLCRSHSVVLAHQPWVECARALSQT
ncbi:hypothetical protein PF005_g17128 [Phytophthora fragariae]|uniref:Uncharacterized protein n=1 Tax=Phytophthora fragariae TaxID=53985 RepID=A0A6A4CZV2_9STRA|nr:hypothetical protein PF003_g30102 [Phytophthora fragariae]KAE8932392.1 hypothetical protein PF009_g17585 [Phytophthora fragariae]KAE8998243.1 hypothetical protein PF011_g15134 [Phytophthora fragariae]KAE9096760.1 hypothetical protein PF010_g16222 [Phytophthora fragariae]KAE9100406.1 hypothetical protein PF007_g15525 [Phytophthora fragariae]